jgi:hypothetical protein
MESRRIKNRKPKNKMKKIISVLTLIMLLPMYLSWAGVKTLTDNKGEFNIFTFKLIPVADDILAIEDSASSPLWLKKKITFSSLDSLFVPKSLFDAHSVLMATTDNTPVKLTIDEESVLGRLTGENIKALTLGVAPGNVMKAPADPGVHTLYGFDNVSNTYKPFTIGTHLSFDQPTSTISATGFQYASFVNVKDPTYGATGDGVTDDTTAIQAACNVGGSVYFPPGTYKISSAITLSVAGTYFGAGKVATNIKTTSATADIFNIQISDVHIKSMGFASFATRTGGYYINAASSNIRFCSVEDFFMDSPFYGIHMTWDGGEIKDGQIFYVVQDGIGINVQGYGGDVISNVTFVGPMTFDYTNDATAEAYAGIYISSCIQMYISNCNFNFFTAGIMFSPDGGGAGVIEAVYITDTVIDQNRYGVYLGTALAGSHIANVQLTNVWSVSNTHKGVIFLTSNGGKIKNTLINNSMVLHNEEEGIYVGSGTSDLRIANSVIAMNGMTYGSGIYLASGVSRFSLIGNKIGATEFVGDNGRYGIEYGGSNTDGTVIGNDMLGNTLGATSGAPATNFVNLGNLTAASGTTFGIPISATSKILGRKTAGAGDAEELSAADVKTILNVLPSTGQTYSAGQRVLGTAYQNTTGKALQVYVTLTSSTVGEASACYVGSTSSPTLYTGMGQIKIADYYENVHCEVPVDWWYIISGGGNLVWDIWTETW